MLLNGKDAMSGAMPELEPYEFDASRYDMVLLGSPIWAGRVAPAMNTFIEESIDDILELGPENIGVFLCQSGKNYKGTFKRLRKQLGVKRIGSELSLVDPYKNIEDAVDNLEKIAIFCRQMVKGGRRRSRIIR